MMLRTRLLAAAAAAAAILSPAAAFGQTAQEQGSARPTSPAAGTSTGATSTPAQGGAVQTPTGAAVAQAGTVIDVLRARGGFTTLLSALDQAQLTETLASRPAVSIFAPTDEAFAALPEAERTRLLEPGNAAALRERLLYHVIVADVSSDQIEGTRGGVQTAAQAEVQLDGTGEVIRVDGATVLQADIEASNGAVFAIDQVLDPTRSGAAMGDAEAQADAGEPAGAAGSQNEPADEAAAEEAPASSPPTLPTERTAPPPAAGVVSPSPATTNPAPAGAAAQPGAGTGVTATVRPAAGEIAADGRPAASVITVQSPPVRNPTDGQVDEREDPGNPQPTPRT